MRFTVSLDIFSGDWSVTDNYQNTVVDLYHWKSDAKSVAKKLNKLHLKNNENEG
jgi:hypothetical protein